MGARARIGCGIVARLRLPPHRALSFSAASSSQVGNLKGEECREFLPWLRKKAGTEISSVLSIGNSSFGRSIFASEPIQDGDCIMEVPYRVQLTLDKLPVEVLRLLNDDVENVAKVAVVLMMEQNSGHESGWAPYINFLPCMDEMHNMMFWSPNELQMIRQSSVYKEAIEHKQHVEKEFSILKPALEHFPQLFGEIKLENFMHACALVSSRAWKTSKGVSLIPFADFLNHDGASGSMLLSDEYREVSEVIADRNYAVGEQVMIRYGKYSNATLSLDFGFTLPHNIYDQAHIWMDIPVQDPLYKEKVELLQKHCRLKGADINSSSSTQNSFVIKEVRSPRGKGKGIPQGLRAFARVLSATSVEELQEMALEAAENDGRLARRPLKDEEKEIHAHRLLLSHLDNMIQGHCTAIEELKSFDDPAYKSVHPARKYMARDLLDGELRVLQSACSWLANYCQNPE